MHALSLNSKFLTERNLFPAFLMTIPRWFGTSISLKSKLELHGFGDASTKAYGVAVYIQVIDSVGQVSSN